MKTKRCRLGLSGLNGKLYAAGGYDSAQFLSSVERYDPIKNIWDIDVQPTSSCRTSVGVAVLGNYLYFNFIE